MTATDILRVLNICNLSNPKYLINNLYVFGWESDYLAMTKAGYWHEIEVKISRADFFADFKKREKHLALSGQSDVLIPNKFTYCVPEGLISAEEVPEYAGLYYVKSASDRHYTVAKPTPQLHKIKHSADVLNLADKFYYNYKSQLNASNNRKEVEAELRGVIQMLKTEFKAATGYDVKEIF